MPGNSNNALNGTRNNIAYVGVNAPQPPNMLQVGRAPTTQDKKNVYQGDFWIDTTTKNMYTYLGNDSSGNAVWSLLTSAGGDVLSLSDDANTLVTPTVGGNIQIEGNPASGISVTADTATNKLIINNTNRSDISAQTTNNTPTAIETYAIPVTSSVIVTATILGSKADYSNSLGLVISRAFRRDAGAATACGATVQQVLCSDAPIGVTADLTLVGNSAALVVTGEAATTYNWSATFEYITIDV